MQLEGPAAGAAGRAPFSSPGELAVEVGAGTASVRRAAVGRWMATGLVYAALGALVLVTALPVVFVLVKSTQSATEVMSAPLRMAPGDQAVANYVQAWSQFRLARLLGNSLLMATVGTAGKVVTALLGALAFTYFRFPGRHLLFSLVMATLMLPVPVILVPLFEVVTRLGWANGYLALTVPYMASATGIFLFRQHFLSIPPAMVDAARIDGAGPLRFLWSVLLPMSRHVISALAVIQFVYLWNEYLWPLVITTSPEMQVVQIGLKQMIGGSSQSYTNWGVVMAGAVVAMLPPLVVLFALHDAFMRGIGLGEEK